MRNASMSKILNGNMYGDLAGPSQSSKIFGNVGFNSKIGLATSRS